MLGFDALGRFAFGQVADAGSTVALSIVTATYMVAASNIAFSVTIPVSTGSYAVSANPPSFIIKLTPVTGSYTVAFPSVSFVTRARRPLYIRGSSYWKGVS